MAENRYFVGKPPKNNMAKIYEVILGSEFDQLKPSKSGKTYVKLPLGDIKKHACLNSFKEFDNKGILKEMEKDEWD